VCAIEYYSVIKTNEILSLTGKWMELENIILSEVSQVQKDKGHVFSHMWKIDPNANLCINIYLSIYKTFLIVRLLEETREGGKGE
jgi:hypothetical protein